MRESTEDVVALHERETGGADPRNPWNARWRSASERVVDVNWNAEIRTQLEMHWSGQPRPRLEGLTDEESVLCDPRDQALDRLIGNMVGTASLVRRWRSRRPDSGRGSGSRLGAGRCPGR